MLYIHQVCQGCYGLYIIVMILGRTHYMYTTHTIHTMYTQDCTRYNITQCTVDSTTDYCYSIYMWYVHPVGQGCTLRLPITMVKVCALCRHNTNMLQQNPNKYIMYTCNLTHRATLLDSTHREVLLHSKLLFHQPLPIHPPLVH